MTTFLDRCLIAADAGLKTLGGAARATRDRPVTADTSPLNEDERRLAGALMRVNHVGEVCAQALYQAQALTARDDDLRAQMAQAAREEVDHLAWTEDRLRELDDRPSWLNPLWYAGAFAIGLAAGRAGDRWSLGFVVETERQVAACTGGTRCRRNDAAVAGAAGHARRGQGDDDHRAPDLGAHWRPDFRP
jgi:3-demethoxyubiquinol 3-hydroxylase